MQSPELSHLPLRDALALSVQLADLDAIVSEADARLASIRNRKPYPVRAAASQVARREKAIAARNEINREYPR